jgi:hypothetical protein
LGDGRADCVGDGEVLWLVHLSEPGQLITQSTDPPPTATTGSGAAEVRVRSTVSATRAAMTSVARVLKAPGERPYRPSPNKP